MVVAFSPFYKYCLASSKQKGCNILTNYVVEIWNFKLNVFKRRLTCDKPIRGINDLSFSQTNKKILVCLSNSSRYITVWDFIEERLLESSNTFKLKIRMIKFSKQEKDILLILNRAAVIFYNTLTGQKLNTFNIPEAFCIDISPFYNGNIFAVYRRSETDGLLNLKVFTKVEPVIKQICGIKYPLKIRSYSIEYGETIGNIQFSPFNKNIIGYFIKGILRIYNFIDKIHICDYNIVSPYSSMPLNFSFSPLKKNIILCNSKEKIVLYNLKYKKQIFKLERPATKDLNIINVNFSYHFTTLFASNVTDKGGTCNLIDILKMNKICPDLLNKQILDLNKGVCIWDFHPISFVDARKSFITFILCLTKKKYGNIILNNIKYIIFQYIFKKEVDIKFIPYYNLEK